MGNTALSEDGETKNFYLGSGGGYIDNNKINALPYGVIENDQTLELTIIGGADSTNPKLIQWFLANQARIRNSENDNAMPQLKPFLTGIANAIRTKKGTTAPINAQNFASEIESIEGGGSAIIKGVDATVATAVPIHTLDSTETDAIQNIYLNTQLSVEEVCNLIDECNTTFNNGEKVEEFNLIVFCTSDFSIIVGVMYVQGIYALAFGNESSYCFAYDSTGTGQDITELGFSGWNSEISNVIEVNTYNYIGLMSSYPSSAVCNEILKNLLSITPIITIPPKVLSGEYTTKTINKRLNITENGTTTLSYKSDLETAKELLDEVNIDLEVNVPDIPNKLFFKGTITLSDTISIKEFVGFYNNEHTGGGYGMTKDRSFNAGNSYSFIYMTLTSSEELKSSPYLHGRVE